MKFRTRFFAKHIYSKTYISLLLFIDAYHIIQHICVAFIVAVTVHFELRFVQLFHRFAHGFEHIVHFAHLVLAFLTHSTYWLFTFSTESLKSTICGPVNFAINRAHRRWRCDRRGDCQRRVWCWTSLYAIECSACARGFDNGLLPDKTIGYCQIMRAKNKYCSDTLVLLSGSKARHYSYPQSKLCQWPVVFSFVRTK